MIPKIIHYCWFGPKKLSAMEERCIASWKKYCPDYEIRKWTEKDFDFSANKYASEALAHGAWAFLSDYARNLILVKHGGIYMDTDVELCRSLDSLLDQDGFCGVEEDKINSGLGFGVIPGHPVTEALVKLYDDASFILQDGKRNMCTNTVLQHKVFESFGFSSAKSGTVQKFSGMTAYPPEYFCPKSYRDGSMHKTENTFSVHHYHASWASPASRIGYHLRRMAGEKVYSFMRTLFHVPEKAVSLWCFLLVFCQNLRGVLHAASLDNGNGGKILSLLMILLAGGVLGLQILKRRISRTWLTALVISGVILAASPWNVMLLWIFLLGGVMACFPFRLFAKCNIVSLALILVCWFVLVFCGAVPSSYPNVKKIVWMHVFDFGFDNPNHLSFFLFQLAAFSYMFIRSRKMLVLSLIPVSAAVVWFSGGRCYSLAMCLIAVLHFMPKPVKLLAAGGIGRAVCILFTVSLVLGYCNPQWSFLDLLNYRIPYWHENLVFDTSIKSILLGNSLKARNSAVAAQSRCADTTAPADTAESGKSLMREQAKKTYANGRLPAFDSAYLQLFINTGILGVIIFFRLMFGALKKHRRMLVRLLPVWTALVFAGFFESHVFGSSMLGLLTVYFFFRRKGRYDVSLL